MAIKKLSKGVITEDGPSDEIATAVAECDRMTDTLTPDEEALITASEIQLPGLYLSPSQIDMYLRCPQQYKRRYIDKVISPPDVALVEGTSHHAALEQNNLFKIKKGVDMEPKKILSAFKDAWATNKKKDNLSVSNEEERALVDRGATMIGEYCRVFAPLFKPVEAEKMVCVPVGPIRILGIMDAIGGKSDTMSVKGSGPLRTIVDYKTVNRAKSQSDADSSLQLSCYVYFHGKKWPTWDQGLGVGLLSLVKSNGNVEWTSTRPSTGRVKWFRQVALQVANAISLGSFPPTTPGSWCCSQRFCGYFKDCRGKVEFSTSAKKKK